jgi:outer membrane assembly lipoprotein YfiO
MSLEELRTKKNECLAANNKKIAIKYLEKMVPLCNDLHELDQIMFELANLLCDLEQYAKASAMYQEYVKLYPSSKNAEEALYKAIKSNLQLISDAERDQTTTHETIELTDLFLTRPSFTTYKKEVTKIRITCHERLLEHELSITNFYLKQGKTRSARRRLEGIRKDYIPQFSAIEPDIICLEYELAQKEHNTEEALQKIALLEEKFPDHSPLQITRTYKKQSFANRF